MKRACFSNRSATSVALIVSFLHVVGIAADESAELPQPEDTVSVAPESDSSPSISADDAAIGAAAAGNASPVTGAAALDNPDPGSTVVSDPAATPDMTAAPAVEPTLSTTAAEDTVDGITVEPAPSPGTAAAQQNEVVDQNFHILGSAITPGESRRLHWLAGETFYGDSLDTPIHIIHGDKPGSTLCLTAAIHGDELNGVEIVLNLMDSIDAGNLSGTIIGVPVVNLLGFTRSTRYLPDRRDLNRYFPGNPRGSSAARIAYSFFEEIIRHCDLLVDLHTGSQQRTNLPQLRADLDDPQVLEFTRHFGATAVLHSRNIRGNLRSAALRAGIPAVTFELGEPGSMQQEHIEYGIKAIETLLDKLGMLKQRRSWTEPQPVYYSSRWVRVNNGGLLRSAVKVGAKVKQGSLLGTIVNPMTSDAYSILSPYNGRVLGMALNQFMLPGYAAFHIGIVADENELLLEPPLPDCDDWENPNNLFDEEQDCDGEMFEETGDDDNNIEESPENLPEDEQTEEINLL